MNSENSSLKTFSHNLGQNWYHLVMIPRCRYAVFKSMYQHKLMCDAIDLICQRHKISLFAKEVMDDHVHLFVSCPPDFSIRKMIQIIKGGTSYYVRSAHPSLRKYPALWSRGCMYRSVGAVSAEVVKRYIANSNHWQEDQKTLL